MCPVRVGMGLVRTFDLSDVRFIADCYLDLHKDARLEVATRVVGDQQGRRQALDEAMHKVLRYLGPVKEKPWE
jgi:hypothetical protein